MFRACLLLDWAVSFAEGLANMVRYAIMLDCSMVSVLTNSPLGFLREIIYTFLFGNPKMIQDWHFVGLIYIMYTLCEGYD